MFPIPKAMSSAPCCATRKGAVFRRRRGGRICAARAYPVTRRSRRHMRVRSGGEHRGASHSEIAPCSLAECAISVFSNRELRAVSLTETRRVVVIDVRVCACVRAPARALGIDGVRR